jgi:hypothetical protein
MTHIMGVIRIRRCPSCFGRLHLLYTLDFTANTPPLFAFNSQGMANSSSNRRRRGPSIEVVDAKVAVDLATAQTYSENVFLFVPNLIGGSESGSKYTHAQDSMQGMHA